MKITKYESGEEVKILLGMACNDRVVGRVSERWRTGGLFGNKWANTVGGWCVAYFRQYAKAPRRDIAGLYQSWAERSRDDDADELINKFLGVMEDEYETGDEAINPEYILDVAGKHFNTVALDNVSDAIRGSLDRGDVEKASSALAAWNKVELGAGTGVDVLHDREVVRSAFESKTEPLIRYPGALGEFFGDSLGRDQFISFTAPPKRGKTWWLQDIAWMGVRCHRKVAMFECGDMSQDQIMRRFLCRVAQRPLKAPLSFPVPTGIEKRAGSNVAEVTTEERVFDHVLSEAEAWDACQRKIRRHKKPLLKLSTHPNSSLNVEGINGILDVWKRDNWVPDIVVVDYADILALPNGYKPGDRDAINENWKQLRALSQRLHGLVVTATQGNSASYDAHIIRKGNFSDDRRKNDHVTGSIGINATEEEKENGVYRLNWTNKREDAFLENSCVHVAGCLALARPHMFSTF